MRASMPAKSRLVIDFNLSFSISEAQVEALLCLPRNQEAQGRVYHGEGRRKLRRSDRGSQAVHEKPRIQDLKTS